MKVIDGCVKFMGSLLHRNKHLSTGFDTSKMAIFTLKPRNVLDNRKTQLNGLFDSCQIQEELAESLRVTQPAISARLKALGTIKRKKLCTIRNEADRRGKTTTCCKLRQRNVAFVLLDPLFSPHIFLINDVWLD